ncbi:hypothetical protein QJQ45_008126 [Haematococcus lacustris]|nr:hypothetical protein QJQ45_008126 [Haematococcus lacustris]
MDSLLGNRLSKAQRPKATCVVARKALGCSLLGNGAEAAAVAQACSMDPQCAAFSVVLAEGVAQVCMRAQLGLYVALLPQQRGPCTGLYVPDWAVEAPSTPRPPPKAPRPGLNARWLRPPPPPSPPPAMAFQALDYQPPPPPLQLGPALGPDIHPPVLLLLGDPSPSVAIYSRYWDAGCLAVDARDGVVAVTVAGWPPSANWSSTATGRGLAVKVTYTARDRAGNTATATRCIKVVDACTEAFAQEFTCPTSLTCSVNGHCGAAAAALSALQAPAGSSREGAAPGSSTVPALTPPARLQFEALAVPDTTPPVITIQGRGQLFTLVEPGDAGGGGRTAQLGGSGTTQQVGAAPPATPTEPHGATGMLTRVTVGSRYVDEGAMAYDVRTGQPELQINLTARIRVVIPVAIDTSVPSHPDKPYLVLYDVADDATPPNNAQQVRRRVQVVCPVDEVICQDAEDPSTLSCSYNGICGVIGMLSSSRATLPGANQPAGALAPPPSTALLPPTLTLLGLQARVQITQGQPYLPCLEGQRQGCEPGATASSVVPGDMDPEIRLCADKALAAGLAQPLPYQQVGLLYCGLDTWQPGQYALTFTVARPGALYGQSGLQAAATRTLVVAALCESGEVACGDGSCSAQDGTCPLANSMQDSGLPISYAATNTPPALTFRPGNGAKHNAELSSPVVRVKQGWQYVLCPPNASPAPDQPCDPGVVASDEEDGPAIQRQVLLCPPAGCESELGGCVGHRVFEKDVADCGIDTGTTAAVGSTFSLVFLVFDSGGLSASVQRLVQVVEPCAPGEVSCQGITLVSPWYALVYSLVYSLVFPVVTTLPMMVVCDIMASLPSASQDADPTTRVLLLPSSATNVTLAAGNETMHVESAPLSFLPCPSSEALGSAAVSCAAVALDSLEGDVSAALQEPEDVSPWDQARCSASSLTTGTCLPGTYIMAYTATNSDGTSTATALLAVFVEQRSVTRLNYSFVSPAASAPAAQLLAAQLLQNSSLVHSLVLSSQLPAFGLYPAYQPYATPPVQQRVRRVMALGAEALQANDSSSAWIIALQLEVDMASCAPLALGPPSSQQAPPVQASSQQRRRLASLTRHHHWTATQPLDGWTSPLSPAPPAPTHAQAPANSSAPGHGRGRSAHLLAAVRGSQEAVRGLQGQLSQLGQLLQQHLSQGALLPELPPRPSQAAPSTGLLEVLMQQGGQGGQGGPLLQSLVQKGGQGGQGGRRSLQQSGRGWVQACGMKLVIPAVVAGASGVPGSLVAASVAEPTCTTPTAPPQASCQPADLSPAAGVVLLGLLAGLVGSLQAGAAAVRASQSTLLQALPVAGGALDATDQQVATELQLWRGAGVDAASSQATRAQVLSDLQLLTRAAQAAQALALASVSSLLAATLDAAITYAQPMQLTTSLLMASLAAQPGGNTSTRDARFSACLLARAAPEGEKYSFLLRRFAEALDPGGQEGGSAAGSRLDPLQHLPGLVASEPRLPRYAGTGGHNKVLAGLLLHVVRKPLSALSDTSRSTCSGSALGGKLDPACSGRRTYSSLSDLGGFGTDPVFNSRSGLFNAHLDVSDWYNASAGSGELSSTQAPFAFFHHPLPGLEAGYPVLVDTGISAKRAAQVLSYLLDGNYVETSLTHSVSVQLLSYNPAAAVFGCWRLRLDWQQDGRIVGTHQVQALPVPDYGAGTSQWVLSRLAPDLTLLLLVVTYCALTSVDVGFTLARQHKIVHGVLEIEAEEAAKLRHAPVAMGKVRQQTLSRTVQWSYASRLTPGWLAYEVTQCALQVAAVAVYFLYVTQVMDGSSFQSRCGMSAQVKAEQLSIDLTAVQNARQTSLCCLRVAQGLIWLVFGGMEWGSSGKVQDE